MWTSSGSFPLLGLLCFTAGAVLKTRDVDGSSTYALTYVNDPTTWLIETVIDDMARLHMFIDTGSSDTWAISADACPDLNVENGKFIPLGNLEPNKKFNVQYGDAKSQTGKVYPTKFDMGNDVVWPFVGAAEDCEQAKRVGSTRNNVLALGPIQGSAKVSHFIASFRQSYPDHLPRMTFRLAGDNADSTLTIGQPDLSMFKTPVQTIDSTNLNGRQWSGKATPYVDGDALGDSVEWIFDTGSEVIMMQEAAAKKYFDNAKGTAPDLNTHPFGSVPCGTVPPDLTFKFSEPSGEKTYKVSGGALLSLNLYVSKDGQKKGPDKDPESCRSYVPISFWPDINGILGGAFWFEHVVVLDYTYDQDIELRGNKISWADAA